MNSSKYLPTLGRLMNSYVCHELSDAESGGMHGLFEVLRTGTDDDQALSEIHGDAVRCENLRYGELTEELINIRLGWFEDLLKNHPERFDNVIFRDSDGFIYGDRTDLVFDIVKEIHMCFPDQGYWHKMKNRGVLKFTSGVLLILLRSGQIKINRRYSILADPCSCGRNSLAWFIYMASNLIGVEVLITVIQYNKCNVNSLFDETIMRRMCGLDRLIVHMMHHRSFDYSKVPAKNLYLLAIRGCTCQPYPAMYRALEIMKIPVQDPHLIEHDPTSGLQDACRTYVVQNERVMRFTMLSNFVRSHVIFPRLSAIRRPFNPAEGYARRCAKVFKLLSTNNKFDIHYYNLFDLEPDFN